MKIIHHISLSATADIQSRFDAVGIALAEGFASFKISEADERWYAVSELVERYEAVDVVITEFTSAELRNARNLRMVASGHHGYPQPEDDFGYLEETYDLDEWCRTCGIGARQVAPFRMSNEPRWGKRQILQLNWVFDEFFVPIDVWQTVFLPFNVGCRPVVHHRTGEELTTVVQLAIEPIVGITTELSNYPFQDCSSCGRKKYLPISRGFFPAVHPLTDQALFKTMEFFGSGKSGHRAVVVLDQLFSAIQMHQLKGVNFIPVLKSTNSTSRAATGPSTAL